MSLKIWKGEWKHWYEDYSTVTIGQKSEKGPGDLRKFPVTQILVKDLSTKTLKKFEKNNNDNNLLLSEHFKQLCYLELTLFAYQATNNTKG